MTPHDKKIIYVMYARMRVKSISRFTIFALFKNISSSNFYLGCNQMLYFEFLESGEETEMFRDDSGPHFTFIVLC